MASVVIGRPREDAHNSGASNARVPATPKHLVIQLDHRTFAVSAPILTLHLVLRSVDCAPNRCSHDRA